VKSWPRVFFLAAITAHVWAAPAAAQIGGAAPTYTDRKLSDVPNAVAMTVRFWAPGLDEGFVPQGVAMIGTDLFVSAYRSVDPKQGRGPCRLYRIDPASGAVRGSLDLLASCGHAGGLARGPSGRLFAADTREVFEVALDAAAVGKVARTISLTGAVRGSFAAGTEDALWLGTYAKDGEPRMLKFSSAGLKNVLGEADAAQALPLPKDAQGGAFDASGRLWITRSGSRFGELMQLDAVTGEVKGRYAVPAGIEDASFDAEGQLWSLSEAGSRRWLAWETFFPVIFRIDPQRLR
jgi:sugar lactone lactonase YvrE